jgi:cytochrome c oxidase assembly factor CtaG
MIAAAGHMLLMGLLVSVAAPAAVVATRRWYDWRWLSAPAWLALPAFIAVHGVMMLTMEQIERRPLLSFPVHTVLFLGAVLFWLPVLGRVRRLSDAGRCVYLFVGAPALDLAGVVMVARGDAVGGLSMIVGMLPIGVVAVLLTWGWVVEDERSVRAAELAAGTRADS